MFSALSNKASWAGIDGGSGPDGASVSKNSEYLFQLVKK
jgi:hypothetical protein